MNAVPVGGVKESLLKAMDEYEEYVDGAEYGIFYIENVMYNDLESLRDLLEYFEVYKCGFPIEETCIAVAYLGSECENSALDIFQKYDWTVIQVVTKENKETHSFALKKI